MGHRVDQTTMRLTVVGCSGSFPGPDSPASCYLTEAADEAGRTWRFLLDLGNGALGPLHRHVTPDQLDAVFITHLHPDHFMDLCGLYVALRYRPGGQAPPRRLRVIGPRGIRHRILEAYGPDAAEGLDTVFEFVEWRDGEQLSCGPVTVLPRRVEHPVEAYGLRLEFADRALVYTGDTDTCPALDELADGADLLLAEAAFQEDRDTVRGVHLTGRRAGEVARTAQAERLVLTHLPVWTDADTVLKEARSAFGGTVCLAAPGERYLI
jgi:ribonuclease BN (tRNA processing enzyme)